MARHKRLEVSNAFHSHYMEPALEQFERFITNNIKLSPPQLPIVSNLTGQLMEADTCTNGRSAHQMSPVGARSL